jgi:hypothetical protein
MPIRMAATSSGKWINALTGRFVSITVGPTVLVGCNSSGHLLIGTGGSAGPIRGLRQSSSEGERVMRHFCGGPSRGERRNSDDTLERRLVDLEEALEVGLITEGVTGADVVELAVERGLGLLSIL